MPEIIEFLERDETGDAELLARLYEDRIAYDHSERRWYLWNGQYWQRDTVGSMVRLVSDQVAGRYLYAATHETEAGGEREEIDALTDRARVLRRKYRIRNVLELAQSQPVGIDGTAWDADPWLLGCANGTINLESGTLLPGDPGDYIRTVCPAVWRGRDAQAKRWESFLLEIFDCDTELIAFVQRLFGYAITGHSTEHILPVLWGEGRNGKDTLLETLKHVLGDLVSPVDPGVLVETGRDTRSASPHRYGLRQFRLVWVSETNEGARLNAGQVKHLTGGGTITARPLYGNPVTFKPQFLLMLITNNRPYANADDYALWKRLLLVPFEQRFVDDPDPSRPDEHKRDPDLLEKLKAEASGILAWLVRGCVEWRIYGLRPPQTVKAATEEYRQEEDLIGQFLEEKCVTGLGIEVQAGTLYQAYKGWCDQYGAKPMSLTAFGKRMKKRFTKDSTRSRVFYLGVGLVADE